MDVRENTSKKRTRERLCTHLIRLYVCWDIIWTSFMEIKLFMGVTDRNCNMVDSGSDLVNLYDINSGLVILQATDNFNKLNENIL